MQAELYYAMFTVDLDDSFLIQRKQKLVTLSIKNSDDIW